MKRLMILCSAVTLLVAGRAMGQPGPTSGSSATATAVTSGVITSNDYAYLQLTPNYQRNIERLPWRGNYVGSESDATNKIAYHRVNGRFGYNIIAGDVSFYQSAHAGGHLAFNTANYPSGLAGWKQICHTNGWRWMLWYDSVHSAPSDGVASDAQMADDIATICSWGPDIIWCDEVGQRAAIAAKIVSTNLPPIQLMVAVGNVNGNYQIDQRTIAYGNGWRLHSATDISDWNSFKGYADLIETNAWRYVGAGSFPYVGPEVASIGSDGNTAVALQAMWSANLLEAFVDNATSAAGLPGSMTNSAILDIQWDPLAVCARRVLVTNGCWVYLKPLLNNNYAMCVVNTNSASTNATITLNDLNAGLQQSLGVMPYKNYTFANLRLGASSAASLSTIPWTNALSIASLASHDYALYKLIPVAPGTAVRNFYTPGMMDMASADGWTRVTHETYYGPFGGGNNIYLRDGWTAATSGTKYQYLAIPDWAKTISVSRWIGCTATAAWTNTISVVHFTSATGEVNDDTGAPQISIIGTNGVVFNGYTINVGDSQGFGPKYLFEQWQASTNTTATRMIVGGTDVVFQ